MKRFLVVLAVISLVGLLLLPSIGCKPKAKPLEGKVTFWEQMDPAELEVFKALVANFEINNPTLKIEVTHYTNEELRDQFQTATLAGQGPDFILAPNDFAGPFVTMKLLKSADEVFDKAFLNLFVESALNSTKLTGKVWGVPDRNGNHLMLIYNKDMLPEPPKDTDELITLAKKFTDAKAGKYGFVFNIAEPFWVVPWLGGYGGWVMDENNNPTLDTEAMVKTVKWLKDLKDIHKIVPPECDYGLADTLFKEQKSPMIINGDWSLGGYSALNMGVTRIPKVKETGLWPSPMTSSKAYFFNKDLSGDKLTIVKKFIEFITLSENQMEFVKKLRILPSKKEAANLPEIANDLVLKGSMDQMVVGKPMPVVPEMRAIWDSIRSHYEAVLAGIKKPEDAAKDMQSDALKKIKEMRGE